jgi:molecular chaperone GrpE
MAENARKIPIDLEGPGTDDEALDVSFEAADAVPGVADDAEDNLWERMPIDLDAPVKSAAASPAPQETMAHGAVLSVSTKELDDLKAQVKTANDERLRAIADLQNFRRRGEEERLRIIRDANERLIKDLLPVLDDFDLALDAASKTESYEQLIGGVSAVARKFQETLGKQGVAVIPAVGEPFNTEVHEAVMLDEESDAPEETVTSELRKGYKLYDRVIRPSLVKVAKKS